MVDRPEGRLFINNEYRDSRSGELIKVYNPFDFSIVSEVVQSAGHSDVDDAVQAAWGAFDSWKRTSSTVRAGLMTRLAELVDAHAKELGRLETVAMGAPVFIAEYGVHSLANHLRYYAGWADKISGDVFPDSGDGVYRMVSHEPLGVCGGIAAWNGTFQSIGWKVAPAIAAGNTYVFKASEKSPLGALALGKLVVEAGFPPGVINLISGRGNAGAALASHMSVAKISFTGSTTTGRKVQIAAAKSNLKKCTLELGGKSAAIVFDDANIDNVLEHMSSGFLINNTQVCAATTRLLVQDSLAGRFVPQLKQKFEDALRKLGDPAKEQTFVGPLADESQFQRVLGFVDKAREEGIVVLTGGQRHGVDGYHVQPTILVDPPRSSTVYRDEIFGPVLCVLTFHDEQAAIAMANDSAYGLGASIYTSNMSRGLRVSKEIAAGSIGINQPVVPDIKVPFGGIKDSGYGRESGKEGILAYLETKTVSINIKA